MLKLIIPQPDTLSDKERLFHSRGFDSFQKGDGALCFRQFFLVRQLTPLWIARLRRMGTDSEDTISICYSESDNVVSACVLTRDLYIEHDATSPAGVCLLWGFGIEV